MREAKDLIHEMRLNTIHELEEQYLPFKLGEQQIQALECIIDFIHSDELEFGLSGSAGTGKTSITKLVVHYLESINKPYLLATPTNKAKGVLSRCTDREVITLHRLLSLKPNINILKLDFKDLQWSVESINSGIPYNGVLIADECSMINAELHKFVIDAVQERCAKVIWQGDACQLSAVKEHHISQTFQCKNNFTLTQVYRQKGDNPILDILCELREKPRYKFSELRSDAGNLYIYNDWQRLIKNNIDLYKEAVKHSDPNLVKLLAYTNKRVEAFNNVIRKAIFKDTVEYHVGEILMGYDTCLYRHCSADLGFSIVNSEDYIVRDVYKTQRCIGPSLITGYELTIEPLDNYGDFGEIFIISKENSAETFDSIAAHIELIRLDAIHCKNKLKQKQLWKQYFNVMESFCTPFDLIYSGRTVRKKTLDYGYCISCHRSQGSNYENVLVDMNNLFICKDKEELRQLQYVALSRTRNNISLLM